HTKFTLGRFNNTLATTLRHHLCHVHRFHSDTVVADLIAENGADSGSSHRLNSQRAYSIEQRIAYACVHARVERDRFRVRRVAALARALRFCLRVLTLVVRFALARGSEGISAPARF